MPRLAPLPFLLAACLLTASAQSPASIHVVVRAKGGGTLSPSNLHAELGGKEISITRVQRIGVAGGAALEIAVLIDESVRPVLSREMDDLVPFLGTLPTPVVAVGVGFMRMGKVILPNGFSTDPDVVLKSLLLPATQRTAGNPSAATSDLANKMPLHADVARIALLFTSGIDYDGETFITLDERRQKLVDLANKDAQRASLPLYIVDCGTNARGLKYLDQLADATGGEELDGMSHWHTILPFLQKFKEAVAESYWVEIAGGEPELKKLKLSAAGVKLRTQKQAMARQSVPPGAARQSQ